MTPENSFHVFIGGLTDQNEKKEVMFRRNNYLFLLQCILKKSVMLQGVQLRHVGFREAATSTVHAVHS